MPDIPPEAGDKMSKTHIKRIVLTVLLAIGIVCAFAVFIKDNSDRIYSQNEEYLNELTTQRAISVDNLFSEDLSSIHTTAYLYGQNLTSKSPDVPLLRDYEENSVFNRLRFIDAQGDNYTSKGLQANLADREYFQAGMRGETGITYVAKSRVTGEKQVGFYSPVYYKGEIIGVMVGFYGEEYIENLLDFELFGHEGEGWLCDADGTIMGGTVQVDYDNYFEYMEKTGRCTGDEIEHMKAAFASGEKTAFEYTEDGVDATGFAAGLKYQDWMLIRNFPPAASQQILQKANGEGIRLVIVLTALFTAYSIILAFDMVLENRRVHAANRDANEVSVGVSRMFESFVGVDMRTGEYRYLQDSIPSEEWPREGMYPDLVDLMVRHMPEKQERGAARGFLSLDNMREVLRGTDRTAIRLHANVFRTSWLTCNFIVTEREDGEPVRMVVGTQDITALHDKEEQEQRRLQEARATAEKASRAKTDFLFNMSHDLRTPMNAIIGYTELARRDGVTEDEMHDYFDKIDSSSKHLLSLINDILEMSRVESGKMTLDLAATDLTQMMRDTQELFATQMAEKNIGFLVDMVDVRDPWVLCDGKRLDRVILNLVGNAYKFTPEGGMVSVVLAQTGFDSGAETASFELRVRDTGIGMSPEFAAKLFAPFERERTSTVSGIQGTGLGLSITRSIVDLMGGTIDVETEQGMGTEFTVRLAFPVVEAPERTPQTDVADGPGVSFEGVRALLVEDNDINREIVFMILSQEGFEVETAENGRVAVDKVSGSEPGHFDLVLMDVQMPVMDGYAATRAIRALRNPALASIPILAMTANAFQEDVQAASEAGMDGHIAKPLDVQKMMGEIRRVLARTKDAVNG